MENTQQVTNYISRLSEIYQTAFDENLILRKQVERTGIATERAVKTLIDADILAQKIIRDAQETAIHIVCRAE